MRCPASASRTARRCTGWRSTRAGFRRSASTVGPTITCWRATGRCTRRWTRAASSTSTRSSRAATTGPTGGCTWPTRSASWTASPRAPRAASSDARRARQPLAERDQLGACRLAVDVETAHADGKTEAPGPGAARVEEQHAVAYVLGGLMRVTGHDDSDAGGRWIEIQLMDVVDDVDRYALGLEQRRRRNPRGPRPPVVVAADGGDGRDLLERGEHLRRADVAGVNDLFGAPQRRDRFGAEQAVRVGDDADDHGRRRS